MAHQVDVTSGESLDAAFAATRAPSLLVNNAGIVRFGPLLELPEASRRSVVDVNLTGTFLTSRVAAALHDRRRRRCDREYPSVNGISGGPHAGAYTSTQRGASIR